MKTNGIVRKVDGLGRIVIPREFRKLYKISLGDPIEISCLDGGEIVLRKMDMTLTLEELIAPALESLRAAAGGTVLVSNTDKWICGKVSWRKNTRVRNCRVRSVVNCAAGDRSTTGKCTSNR